MAMETLIKKSLVLVMSEGVDGDGKPILKRYTYSNINPSATVEQLLAAANALASMYEGNVHEFNTVDTSALDN